MHPEWLIVTAVGLVIVAVSVAGARWPTIPPAERRAFHAVNDLPNALYPVLWPPMQLGNLVVGTVAGLAAGYFARDLAVVVGVVLAMVFKLVTERIVRREMADYLSVRQRPGTSQDGAILRGADVPRSGPSFPSGHVILVAGVACVVAPTIPAAWWWLPLLLVFAVMIGRVYVGAHNPLDVSAGLGAGLVVGGLIATFVN
jgi:membrane-associated phospholipid phosphatase